MKLASHTTQSTGSGISFGGQMARIGAFQHHDARIVAQLPRQLAVADIDGIDLRGAVGQQHVGEAAGRGADIDRDRALGIEREMRERVRELQPAARDPGMILALDLERRVLRHQVAGLGDAAVGAEHLAGHDQRLGLGAGLDQAALDQQLVGALPSPSGDQAPRQAPPAQEQQRRARPRGRSPGPTTGPWRRSPSRIPW